MKYFISVMAQHLAFGSYTNPYFYNFILEVDKEIVINDNTDLEIFEDTILLKYMFENINHSTYKYPKDWDSARFRPSCIIKLLSYQKIKTLSKKVKRFEHLDKQ